MYRPLYHCGAKSGRFEAHTLAVSHFARWDAKFERVAVDAVPAAARAMLLRGPFVSDAAWPPLAAQTAPIAAGTTTRSGVGTRSHDARPLAIDDVLGDWRGFVAALHSQLLVAGIDPLERGYEMDHICFRTDSAAQYLLTKRLLVPRFGSVAIEGMIGGRPILTVALHAPLLHPLGYTIAAIEGA